MGRLFLIDLEGNFYSCKHCKAHLALNDDIISKSFQCSHGKAYLFENVVNVTTGEPTMRMMITGHHLVCDIFCVGCNSSVGWKYLTAFAIDQKYKEGKFILERASMSGPDGIDPDGAQNMVADVVQPEGSDGEGLEEDV